MKNNKKILIFLLAVLMIFTSCDNVKEQEKKILNTGENSLELIELDPVTKDINDITFSDETYLNENCRTAYNLLMMSQLDKNVTYKKEDIIEGIRAVNVGEKMLMMSRAITIDDLDEFLPIDNVRRIETENNVTFLIEYPMEDCTFVVIVSAIGIIRGTYMQAEELRSEKEMSLLLKGMSLEAANKLYPEIIINPKVNQILSENSELEKSPQCVVALKDRRKATIRFEKKGKEFVISEVEFSDNPFFDEEEWKFLSGNEGELSKKETGLVFLENKIIQGENLWNEFVFRSKTKEPCSIKIKHYYVEDYGASSFTLRFDGEFYSIIDSITSEEIRKYKYLVELSGKIRNAKSSEHGFYLVNDKNLTYDELMWSMLSSQTTDHIDFRIVYTESE